eukprot:16441911-Heterocapsa_arctica.AAC.2
MSPVLAWWRGRSAYGLLDPPEVSDPALAGGAVPTRAVARCQRSLATDWSSRRSCVESGSQLAAMMAQRAFS